MIARLLALGGVLLLVDALVIAWLAFVAHRHVHQWEVAYTPTTIYLACRCGFITDGWRLFETPPGCERVDASRIPS